MRKERTLRSLKHKEKKRKCFGSWTALVGVAIGLSIGVICGCPFYSFFGICCPCCGVTRAWLCVFRGDVIGAFRYHGLFPILPLILMLYILIDILPCKWVPVANAVLIISGAAVAVYGVLRWCGLVAMP